jgi:hypothetical protein
MKKQFLIICLSCIGFWGYGQQIDSLETPDLTQPDLKLEKIKVKDWPNPNKALLFSIIPAGGQIYNKRWWKVPIVYGALGVGISIIDYNRGFYLQFKEALTLSRAGLPHDFSELGYTSATLKIKRDLANRYMQQAYLGTLLVYLLQSTEAFVDAHLRNFDMNEDLSFELHPLMEVLPELNQPVVGLSISIPIGR